MKQQASWVPQARVWSAFFVFCFALLGVRLFQIQLLAHSRYLKQARESHGRTRVIAPLRGTISDRQGRPLAVTLSLYSIGADPSLVQDPRLAASKLAPVLKLPAEDLEAKLRRPGRFVWLLRKTDSLAAKRISDLRLK